MLVEGLQVMLLGVGVVFAFLGLLVATLWALAVVVSRWERVHPSDRPPHQAAEEMGAVAAAVAAASAARRRERG